MDKRITKRRSTATHYVVALGVGWMASLGFPANAADIRHRSRQVDKSAERALERAEQAASDASSATTAIAPVAAASAASAPAPAASSARQRPNIGQAAPPPSPSPSAPESTAFSLTLGGAYRGNDRGHTWTTPFILGADGDAWHAEFNGDGHVSAFGSKHASGQGDVSVLASYDIDLPFRLVVAPSLQWTFPAGGDVGSQRSAQEFAVLVKKKVSRRWIVSVASAIDRDTEDDARSPQYGKTVSASLKWKKNEDVATAFTIVRDHPAGERSRTKLGLEHDFSLWKNLDGALVVGRTLAGSDSADKAEFDLTWSF